MTGRPHESAATEGATASPTHVEPPQAESHADACANASPTLLRPATLYIMVFLAGIGSMATEMCASRLLAPYYGASTVVWANIIGLILASLSLGYWLGGRLADSRPRPRVLGVVILTAAVLIALIPFVAKPLLNLSVRGMAQFSAGAVIGSFAASLLLFVPPVTLLGMVTPFAIRLGMNDVTRAGQVAGRVFALSTVGSLLGTFLPALLTIPLVGTQRTLLGCAVLIAVSGALLLGRYALIAVLALAALLAVPPGAVKAQPHLIHEEESLYQFIQVVEQGPARDLYLNEGHALHSTWRPDTVLTGGPWDMSLAPPLLLGRGPGSVAVLGNAGGTIARAYGRFYPEWRVDGAEIDPAVTEVGRRFFGLSENPAHTAYDEDARPFLLLSSRTYDIIIAEAYRQPYVPFYLATREFFRLCFERLAPDGILALNVSQVPGDDQLVREIAGTLTYEFPQVLVWPALTFNQYVLGFKHPMSLEEAAARLAGAAPELLDMTALMAAQLHPAEPVTRPWTDDRAPVEWVIDRMIVQFATGGGVRGEVGLPTAP